MNDFESHHLHLHDNLQQKENLTLNSTERDLVADAIDDFDNNLWQRANIVTSKHYTGGKFTHDQLQKQFFNQEVYPGAGFTYGKYFKSTLKAIIRHIRRENNTEENNN